MNKLKIITGADNPILRRRSEDVQKFDGSLKKFAKALREKMLEADGLGLAAPQVSENIRVIAVTLGYGTDKKVVVAMVNPVIVYHGEETVLGEEGCLSLPGIYGKVDRWKELTVEFADVSGVKQILNLSDLDARVVQHEIDHLDGVMFIDRMKKGEKVGDLLL